MHSHEYQCLKQIPLPVPLHWQKSHIHQVNTMLATFKNLHVLFPGHIHLLTTGTDDPSLASARVTIKVSGHQHWWLAGGYYLETGHCSRWLVWWLPGG